MKRDLKNHIGHEVAVEHTCAASKSFAPLLGNDSLEVLYISVN